MAKDYTASLNLPKTDFSMRANLSAREPGMLEEMYKKDLYREMLKKREGKPSFILHDGPPFSNGNISPLSFSSSTPVMNLHQLQTTQQSRKSLKRKPSVRW